MEEPQYKTKTTQQVRQKPRAFLSFIVFVTAIIFVTIVSGVFVKHHIGKPVPFASVRITNAGFQPATLSVKQDTKITWVNNDNTLHQVVSNPYPKGTDLANLKSEILNNNQTYTYTANTVGSFGYHDQLRPTINGTLIVKK